MGFFTKAAVSAASKAWDAVNEPKVIKTTSVHGWNTPSMTDRCIGCARKARTVTDGIRHCHRAACIRAAVREAEERERLFRGKSKGKKAKKTARR